VTTRPKRMRPTVLRETEAEGEKLRPFTVRPRPRQRRKPKKWFRDSAGLETVIPLPMRNANGMPESIP